MDNTFKNINNKYIQARTHLRAYTQDFLAKSASGIISNKSMRKINVISMWLDYIQNYLKHVSTNSLYNTEVSYSDINNLLDVIAFEFDIVYKNVEEDEVEKILSNSSKPEASVQPTQISGDSGVLLTENGKSIEVDAEDTQPVSQSTQSSNTIAPQSSGGSY